MKITYKDGTWTEIVIEDLSKKEQINLLEEVWKELIKRDVQPPNQPEDFIPTPYASWLVTR